MKAFHIIFAVILLASETLCQTDQACDEANLHANAQMCTEPRSRLSEASAHAVETRNHTILCKAFAEYMRCMEPKIGHCNSTTTGFTVIRSTYSAPPYNCSMPPEPVTTPPPPPKEPEDTEVRVETSTTSTTTPPSRGSPLAPQVLVPGLCLTLAALA